MASVATSFPHCSSSIAARPSPLRNGSATRRYPKKLRMVRASTTVDDAQAVSSSFADLKAEILSHVAGLDRGLLASQDDVDTAFAMAKKLEAAGSSVFFPNDLDKLQGRWRLVFSSAFASGNLGGSRPGPPAFQLPLRLGQVYQRIDILTREFDNIVDLRIATPWPFPPVEARANLAHVFELSGKAFLVFSMFTAFPVLQGGPGIKIMFEKTSVKALGGLSELPPLDLPRVPDFVRPSSVGQFDVTFVDDSFRITRGDRGELRVFVKV